jgi:hypothetical protein
MDGCWIGDDFKLLLVAVETHTRWLGKKGERRRGVMIMYRKKRKEERVNWRHTHKIPRESWFLFSIYIFFLVVVVVDYSWLLYRDIWFRGHELVVLLGHCLMAVECSQRSTREREQNIKGSSKWNLPPRNGSWLSLFRQQQLLQTTLYTRSSHVSIH